jgi:hypothetical protein
MGFANPRSMLFFPNVLDQNCNAALELKMAKAFGFKEVAREICSLLVNPTIRQHVK